ncbi:hypothetical protein KVA01_21550 [Kocuria varians]|uniref:Serine aminopeptidase S33 domain-containing protein n=1 Tax=Kocuria varians TaxID=1272 RepID=A0A4Y4DB65_KOCVA|nr:hypothetical protein KVA01_21550 [Kocuria varians]
MFTLSGPGRSLRSAHGSETDGTALVDTPVTHGWIPAGDRLLAVDVHEPAAPARGATVVFAAPPGRERVTTTRTMLHTARALAADGWRVVRFDWSGTGQSPSAEDITAAQRWPEDLRAVREWAGQGTPVHGLAFSLAGAYLAADDDAGWARRVVLAPVTGKQWLRHQSALRRMSGAGLPPRVKEGTELLDLHLSAEGAAAVKAVPVPEADPARGIEILAETETGALPLDVHPRVATVPPELASAVVAALADGAPARQEGLEPADQQPAQEVTLDVAGTPVRLRRATVGAERRPAIVTEPVDRAPDAPGLGLVSPGSDTMEAAGGLWLTTALFASAQGAVCVLAERTDTGELVRSDLVRNPNPYDRRTVVECRELVEHVASLTDGPLTASGICLGAWGLMAAAHELPADVTRRLTLHVVNNVAWQKAPWRYWRQGITSGPLAPRVPGEEPTAPAPAQDDAAASEEPTAESPVHALRRVLVHRAGTVARTVVRGTRTKAHEASPRVNSLAASLGIIDIPQPELRRLGRVPGLTVKAVFSTADAEFCHVTPGALDSHTTMIVIEPLDHSVFSTAARRAMADFTVQDATGQSIDAA